MKGCDNHVLTSVRLFQMILVWSPVTSDHSCCYCVNHTYTNGTHKSCMRWLVAPISSLPRLPQCPRNNSTEISSSNILQWLKCSGEKKSDTPLSSSKVKLAVTKACLKAKGGQRLCLLGWTVKLWMQKENSQKKFKVLLQRAHSLSLTGSCRWLNTDSDGKKTPR